MAKRGQASGEFNMAKEIRSLLTANKNLTGREVVEQLKKKFPKQSINDGSCQVAFANARKKLGLSKVRKKRPVGGAGAKRSQRTWTAGPRVSTAPANPGLEMLLAAKELLQRCDGDASVAAAAIKQVASLQMQ